MKTSIVPILIILFIGAFISNSAVDKLSPVREVVPITLPTIPTSNRLIIDLNSNNLSVVSNCKDQPAVEVNVTKPTEIQYVPKYIKKIIRDTVTQVETRLMLFPINAPPLLTRNRSVSPINN